MTEGRDAPGDDEEPRPNGEEPGSGAEPSEPAERVCALTDGSDRSADEAPSEPPTLGPAAALVGLAVAAALVVAALLIGGNAGGQVIAALISIAAIVLVVAVAVRWSVLLAAIVLDGFGPLKALSRSRAVTKGNAWRVFGV